MRPFIFVILIVESIIVYSPGFCADSKPVSLTEALNHNLITLTAKGLGDHLGECIELEIASLNKKEFQISIDAGLKFIPDSSAMQNMTVTQDKILTLSPKAVRKVKLFAMCIESADQSPAEGSLFAMGAMAEGNLLEVVKFISAKRYQASAAQQAIWCITDSSSIGGISDETNPTMAKELRMLVARLTGKIPPWYQIEYKTESARVFPNEPAVIKADFQYHLTEEGIVTFAIYNEKGEEVQSILENHPEKPGLSTLKIRFETREFPKGKYFVRVTNKGNLIEEKVFEL